MYRTKWKRQTNPSLRAEQLRNHACNEKDCPGSRRYPPPQSQPGPPYCHNNLTQPISFFSGAAGITYTSVGKDSGRNNEYPSTLNSYKERRSDETLKFRSSDIHCAGAENKMNLGESSDGVHAPHNEQSSHQSENVDGSLTFLSNLYMRNFPLPLRYFNK